MNHNKVIISIPEHCKSAKGLGVKRSTDLLFSIAEMCCRHSVTTRAILIYVMYKYYAASKSWTISIVQANAHCYNENTLSKH